MTLKEKIAVYKEGFKAKAPQEAQDIMHRATSDLINSGIVEKAVGVGDTAPQFTLRNTDGADVSLATLTAKGPVVLMFYRGRW